MKATIVTQKVLQLSIILAFIVTVASGFVLPRQWYSYYSSSACIRRDNIQLAAGMSPNEIKTQLQEYLKERAKLDADEVSKEEVGKVLGGTKGNAVLEFISGAPTKEFIVDEIPEIFDYDQLAKYGYANLVTPIMELGGRRAVYELMEMKAPALKGPPPKKASSQIVIDRTGNDDPARYSGLKIGLQMDDDLMGEALAKAQQKGKEGKDTREKLIEESYEQPFADKRNTGPRQTPNWTPEEIDELTERQGKAFSWAKRARANRLVIDEEEIMALDFPMTAYCLFASSFCAFAFGRSTPTFLSTVGIIDTSITESVLRGPGLALILAAIGSSIVSATILAPELNRSSFVWGLKGLCSGPLAILRLRELDVLITQAEFEKKQKTRNSS